MDNLFQKLMRGGSIAALFATMAATSAFGQQANDGDQTTTNSTGVEQVVVSASRISIAGYTAPTPVTVVGPEQLETNSYVDLADSVRDLPSVGNSTSAQNGSNSTVISGAPAGTSTINLRNLGTIRTLVLIDGQRVVQSNITGGVDINTIPTSLVQRVDVVTGGASASWGSDAVAGVVNFILNKNFTGFKANLEAGDNSADTYRQAKMEASWGTEFDGGRGHLILSGSYVNNPDTVYLGQMHWVKGTYLVNNPAYTSTNGQSQLIHENNVGQSQATPGGVILSSPAGTTAPANALAGIQFTGNGQVSPFNFGHTSGALAWGGDANFYTGQGPTNELAQPLRTYTAFAYGSYDVTSNIVASVQLNYGNSWSQNTGSLADSNGGITIYANNPYLPQSVAAAMAAGGIPSFTMGSLNSNNVPLTALSPSANAHSLGIPVNDDYRQQVRGVFTLEGAIGDNWSWNTYYQHGESRVWLRVIGNTNLNALALAQDPVQVTAGNVGSSGLPIGSIVCASTLTSPINGCQPLNVFGNGVASQAAVNYVDHFNTPGSDQYGNIDYENITLNEDVFSGSMQGTLPWGLAAGKPAVAFGGEYRKEGGRTTVDPRMSLAGGTTKWASGNFSPFAGQYNVEEGFAEVDAPLLKDDFVQSVDLQTAGRITNYSTSGLVETWKLGLNSQVNDDIRLRSTWSYDIRAPDLSELFSAGQENAAALIDPKTLRPVSAFSDSIGNPNLKPEEADTISGGVVLTPTFLPGFTASFDWYSINIHGYIYTLGSSSVVSECQAGNQAYCADLIYNGSSYPGALGTVISQPQNAGSETTSGLDFQADYVTDFLNGTLAWHLLGNYTDETTLNTPTFAYDFAGSLGGNALVTGGVPKFKGTLSATYVEGSWSGTIQTRMEGAAKLNNNWVSGTEVDDNDVPFNAYLDLRASYKWTDDIQFYGAVDNVLDTPPPNVALAAVAATNGVAGGNAYSNLMTRTDLYDALGRSIRVGVRFSY
jgi:outer membrane receptor protein involved in Fe transport